MPYDCKAIIRGAGNGNLPMIRVANIGIPTLLIYLIVVVGRTAVSSLPVLRRSRWSGRPDSNRRSHPWEGCILPTELLPRLLLRRMEEGPTFLPAGRFCHYPSASGGNHIRTFINLALQAQKNNKCLLQEAFIYLVILVV